MQPYVTALFETAQNHRRWQNSAKPLTFRVKLETQPAPYWNAHGARGLRSTVLEIDPDMTRPLALPGGRRSLTAWTERVECCCNVHEPSVDISKGTFQVEAEIARAWTLPAHLYTDASTLLAQKDKLFSAHGR